MNRVGVITALLGGLCVSVVSQLPSHAEDQTKILAPSELNWTPITTLPSGAQVAVIEGPLNEKRAFIFRIKMAPGWKVPPHMHPVLTHVTVISGMFNLGLGDKFDASKLRSFSPGTVLILPPSEPHFAQISEETVIQVHGTGPWGTSWVDPKDDPANKKTN